MNKRINKHIFKIVIAIMVLIIPLTVVAYTRLGTGQVSGGASGLKFYIDNSASEYSDSIKKGICYWNGCTNSVSVSQTTQQSSSRCDNYWGDYFTSTSTIVAQTQLILNNQVTYDFDTNWYWCKIYYNKDIYKYEDGNGNGLSFFNRKGTACHEFGHFLGLAHNNTTASSIMCQLAYGRTAGRPSSDDINGITAIYGS